MWKLGLKGLSNDDGNGNDNGKKAIGLDQKNNDFARASRLLVYFLAVVARLQRKTSQFCNFAFYRGRERYN